MVSRKRGIVVCIGSGVGSLLEACPLLTAYAGTKVSTINCLCMRPMKECASESRVQLFRYLKISDYISKIWLDMSAI